MNPIPVQDSFPADVADATRQILVDAHRPTLERAVETLRTRAHWSPYPEDPGAYGTDAEAAGERAFRALLDRPFPLEQPGRDGTVGPAPAEGGEISPYGFALGISYPHSDPGTLLACAEAAADDWRRAGALIRAAVCLEILARINARSAEFAHAAMHTSGHGPVMAFHAGAVHAQDRGLEAVAAAYTEQDRLPAHVLWNKPLASGEPCVMEKTFTPSGRGTALLVGNRIFPAWSGYAGLFASLATGNPVIVKPHPAAVLPLALTVAVARDVLAEAGFSGDLVALAVEHPEEGLARTLAVRPEIRIVDFTGTTAFGRWLRDHARQAEVFTSTTAVNTVLIESTEHYAAMLDNLAFSLALYSGQLCTSPQNILIPRAGIRTDRGRKGYLEVVADLAAAITRLLGRDAFACDLLGALCGPEAAESAERADAGAFGPVVLAGRAVHHPHHPGATVRTPTLVALDAARSEDRATLAHAHPGPVFFTVAVDSADDGVDLLLDTARTAGSLSAGAWTASEDVEHAVTHACAEAGVMLSLNMTGDWYLTQSAVYSDLHGTGANPASDHAFCDGAFVARRFRTVAVRRRV
ncbi:phenylacetic acid degradation protein PaaN [Streptomyces sp. NPDC094466]|uniref:phenylacetic acid degradation protein PaaN n=1 Tax=Streptomyces sp. NPDC094466 TaxID=3366065 RepID=UPI0037F6B4F1